MDKSFPDSIDPLSRARPILSDQPGGGVIVGWEIALAALRRRLIRALFPGHIQRMNALKQGSCPGCRHDVIDSRDLKYQKTQCGFRFDPSRDPYAWREQAYLARHGWAEIVAIGGPLWVMTLVGLGLGMAGTFWGYGLALLSLPFALFVPLFFRNPKRPIPTEEGIAVSPADGVVTHVDEVDEPGFPGGRAHRISIFLSVFSVHINRSPLDATVERLTYIPGEYLDARHSECSRRNEQLWADLRDGEGRLWRVRQVSGAIARRIVCQLHPGLSTTRGEPYGLIKFGSRTELLWPVDGSWQSAVQVGQGVYGGVTVLARRLPKPV